MTPDLVKMLFDAVEEKDEEAVTDLLDKGVDVNAENVLGFTPFMWACQNSTYQIVKLLIDYGADVNKVTEMGRTPMLFAIKGNNIPVVKLLIEKNADMQQRILEEGYPYLCYAAKEGLRDICRVLVRNGSDLLATDNSGRSALDSARHSDYLLTAKYIESEIRRSATVLTRTFTL